MNSFCQKQGIKLGLALFNLNSCHTKQVSYTTTIKIQNTTKYQAIGVGGTRSLIATMHLNVAEVCIFSNEPKWDLYFVCI